VTVTSGGLTLQKERPDFATLGRAIDAADSPCEFWLLSQHRNSFVCKRDAEHVQMA
jgi:hypothetical protein